MINEIIERAKAEILAEREYKIAEECAKVENEMIAPKLAEYERECQQAIALENERHEREVKKIVESYESKKNEYATRIRNSIDAHVENKYHYMETINNLTKLLGE